jgi:putative ABC transport system permease protein
MTPDLRYAVRMLRKKPGFSLLAVLTLALGIGATTAIYSVVDAVLLRPLPYAEPSQLVSFLSASPSVGFSNAGVSQAEFFRLRAENRSFTDVAAFQWGEAVLRGEGEPERTLAPMVSFNYLRTLGANVALGRDFHPEEEILGKNNAVILGYGFWRRKFGGDPAIVGRGIHLNDNLFTVIGVLPKSFRSPYAIRNGVEADLWRGADINPARLARGSQYLTVIGRLRKDAPLLAAQAESNANLRREALEFPAFYPPDIYSRLEPLDRYLNGDVRRPIMILLAAVAVVLLIACANVANLLLVRGEERRQEIAVRTALGASRSAIITQLLTESLLLAALGGLVGILLAGWGLAALLTISPDDIPRLSDARLNFGVIGFAFALSAATAVIFGLAPAFQTLKFDLHATLKEGGRSGDQQGRSRLRNSLVVLETAMAVVLLIGAGLLIRSYWKLQRVDAGIKPEHVLTMQLTPPGIAYREPAVNAGLYDRALERVAALPGVASAALTDSLALSGVSNNTIIEIEGQPLDMNRLTNMSTEYRVVSPSYFETLGIRLVRGRFFIESDREGAPVVMVVNETVARNHWPGEDPIGKRFRLLNAPPAAATSRFGTIIGVFADVKTQSLSAAARQDVCLPLAQYAGTQDRRDARRSFTLIARTNVAPVSLAQSIQRELLAIEAEFLIRQVRTMESVIGEGLARPRFHLLLLGLFAVLALGLGAIGVYGVVSYLASRRTHEIGVRMALGAQAGDVLRMILKQGLRLALAGVVIGWLAALLLTPLMTHMLFGVAAADPLTFGLIPFVLLIVALAACWIPARHAARVDPMVALRAE